MGLRYVRRSFDIFVFFRTSWGTNKLTRGAYSYIATGSTVQDIEKLAEPIVQESTRKVHRKVQVKCRCTLTASAS